MKRSFGRLVAVTAVGAVTALTASPAAATEVTTADDCTTEYVRTLSTGSNDPLVEVTYTPPATITVDADHAAAVAAQVVNATTTYVDCVV